jgi:hypothetical protein
MADNNLNFDEIKESAGFANNSFRLLQIFVLFCLLIRIYLKCTFLKNVCLYP